MVQAEDRIHGVFTLTNAKAQLFHQDQLPPAFGFEGDLPIAHLCDGPEACVGIVVRRAAAHDEPPFRAWLMKRMPSFTVMWARSSRSTSPLGVISASTFEASTS